VEAWLPGRVWQQRSCRGGLVVHAPHDEVDGGVAERDVQHLSVADEQPRWCPACAAVELEPQQVAVGVDAEGAGHAHAAAAGAAAGTKPDLGPSVTHHHHQQKEELQRHPPPRIAAAEHGLHPIQFEEYDDPSRQ